MIAYVASQFQYELLKEGLVTFFDSTTVRGRSYSTETTFLFSVLETDALSRNQTHKAIWRPTRYFLR